MRELLSLPVCTEPQKFKNIYTLATRYCLTEFRGDIIVFGCRGSPTVFSMQVFQRHKLIHKSFIKPSRL